MKARYYDATTGRFLSKDPLFGDEFDPQSLNRYVYAMNNPVTMYDITGLCGEDNNGPTAFQRFAMSKAGDVTIKILEVPAFLGKLSAAVLSVIPVTAPLGATLSLAYPVIEGDYETAGLMIAGFQVPGTFSYGNGGARSIVSNPNPTTFRSFTSSNFRINLGRLTGNVPSNSQAHHIFPQAFEYKFAENGININDPKFGVWWETSSHLRNAKAYNAAWENFLKSNPSKSQMLDYGRQLMSQYGIPVGF